MTGHTSFPIMLVFGPTGSSAMLSRIEFIDLRFAL